MKISQFTVVRKTQKYKLCLVDNDDGDGGDGGGHGGNGETMALAHT
ncbi:MAG: hypothetical protein R3Y11_02605 [Pseudomonadota bacterium]